MLLPQNAAPSRPHRFTLHGGTLLDAAAPPPETAACDHLEARRNSRPTILPVGPCLAPAALMAAWIFLALAIATEVLGTLQLRQLADGFRMGPALVVTVSYVASFALMVPALRTINVGVSYAIWSAVGTAAVAGLGAVIFHERLNALGVTGLVLIIAGVVVLTASGSTTH